MQLVSEPLYSKFLWLLVFFVRVLLSAVCKVILYSIVGIVMCIKAYCYKRWPLEQLHVGEYSCAVNLQFLYTSTLITKTSCIF